MRHDIIKTGGDEIMTTKRRITLRLPGDLKIQLLKEADRLGLTLNALIIMKILNFQNVKD